MPTLLTAMPKSTLVYPSPISWYSAFVSVLFLLFFPTRVWRLRKATVKILPNSLGHIKMLASSLFLASGLWYLVLGTQRNPEEILSSINSGVLPVVAACVACLLSIVEHRRTVHPSTLLTLYLLAYVAGEAAKVTAPANYPKDVWSLNVSIGRLCIGLAFFIVENIDKRSILRESYQQVSTEETVGILGRTFFWWINPILREGNRSILVAEDLPCVDEKLSSGDLRKGIIQAWNNRKNPDGKITLPSVLLHYLAWPLMSAVLPRIFLILFRYSQAVLINVTIQYVKRDTTAGTKSDTGYWLVIAALIVYLGMAISIAIYQHILNRLKIMVRGSLIGLIHHRSMGVQSGTHDEANALALMSTDVNNLESVGEMIHETWAQFFEVIIGTCLLASQIGWLCLVPYLIIIVCSRVSHYVATNLKSKQRNWSIATQARIGMTASMLSAAKSMKMLGMVGAMTLMIEELREQELEMYKKLRWVMVIYNSSANALGIFAPVITLTLFAIVSKTRGDGSLDTATAFTSIALLWMVTHPANMVMTFVPRAVASLANFERIQDYLLVFPCQDDRLNLKLYETEPSGLPDYNLEQSVHPPAVVVNDVTVQYSPDVEAILRNINLHITSGSVMMCSGAVGSGKTTLAKLILGEVSPSRGSVYVSTRCMGLCAQAPWLPSGTIREIICGPNGDLNLDSSWYDTVLHACDLLPDLKALPENDQTQVGSRGLNLSGGQRQRVALARAIYTRCDILMLDDAFRALDSKTESSVVHRLLGPGGILKKMGTTVFMITHAAQHFPLADQIIILADSVIQTQGTWDQLKNGHNEVLKFSLASTNSAVRPENRDQSKLGSQLLDIDAATDDLLRQTGDVAVYSYYFKSVGAANILLLLCCTTCNTFCLTYAQYWLKLWTEASSARMWFYIGGYLVLSLIAWVATSGLLWTVSIKIVPKSGFVLHRRLLNAIIGAPLSYYSENENGTSLNRFGQDIQQIDTQLPYALGIIFTQTSKLLIQAGILFTVQRELIATLPFCIVIVYIVQKIYLRTSRQLRFIELESRSALYSSFLETVEGVTTIRAFAWQKRYEAHNIERLEKSQGPFYLLLCLQRWLNIVLDLLIASIAVGVIALAVILKGTTSGAQIGVALNLILIANTTLLRLVESWTTLEISLGAIARVKSVVERTPQEDKPCENLTPPEYLPSAGAVELKNVIVSYNSNTVALRNVSLKIEAGQKVVICGRTGSGKSTLLLALLNLLTPTSGTITVDGLSLSLIPRPILRQRYFIAVPQDPFIFPTASLRFNLDPYNALPDTVLVTTLAKTQLWKHISRNNPTEEIEGILDQSISSLPPLSTGQLQLLSLARAILRRQAPLPQHFQDTPVRTKPILLLDEATSSLDLETEALVHDVIQEEFTDRGHTVIVVAHRMGAVVRGMRKGVDAVVRMAGGKIQWIGGVEEMAGDVSGIDMREGSRNGKILGSE